MSDTLTAEPPRRRGRLIVAFIGAALAVGGSLLVIPRSSPQPIAPGWGYAGASKFVGRSAVGNALTVPLLPQHPFMAPNGRNNMHGDSYISDTYQVSGPLGVHPQITSVARAWLGGECATVT